MEIIWAPQAIEDIENIGDYIAEDNPTRAVSFIDELILSVDRLLKFPESGPIIEENPVFRHIVHQKYRIIYQLRIKKILVVTVLSPGRNFNL